MNSLEASHSERFPGLPLLTSLFNLTPSHLLLELTFTHTAVIFKRQQDVQRGKLLELVILLPFVRVDHHVMCLPPLREHVHVETLKQCDNLRDTTRASSTAFLLR